MTGDPPTYAFQNAVSRQAERLRLLESVLDPGTIRQLEACGVAAGWRCLEVGAGAGSIAAWLAGRVGPAGSVLATDLDTTDLDRLVGSPNLELRVHDIVRDDLPEAEFDLIHTRYVLSWLAEPSAALRRMVAALKPGGWLVAEEIDFASVVPDPRCDPGPADLFARVAEAFSVTVGAKHALDACYGRRLAGDMLAAGLVDVGCEGRTSIWRGGQPEAVFWRMSIGQVRALIVAGGSVSPEEFDEFIRLCDDPQLSVVSQLTMAASGRRPPIVDQTPLPAWPPRWPPRVVGGG
jgi:SAM-dependent methyltransferase